MFPGRDFFTEMNFFNRRATCEFSKHEILFRETDRADKAYFICKGMIAIIKRNSVGELFQIYTINSGESVGIQDVFGSGKYNSTAIALEPVTAYEITKTEIEKRLNRNVFLRQVFAKALSNQLIHLENQLRA